ncbi:MAG TPA: ABC transporter permease subunit [Candidatus Saccharimonadales bacterium]|nr:ABC transporter permease subunit [Candidatus Saccharimonadales bacterium]
MRADATALAGPRSMPWSRVMGLGSIYAKTVRDSRRAALVVGILGGLLMLATAAPYGAEFTTAESRAQLIGQMTALPPVFRGLLGEPINIDTLGGWISFRAGNILPVMLGLWSVLALSGILAGEAARGSLDLLASTPVSRRSIALQKVAGHVTALAVAVLLMTLITWLASPAFATLPGDAFGLDQAFGFAFLAGLQMLAAGSVAFAAAPFVGRTRALAAGLLVLFGGYVVSSFGSLSTLLDALGPLSFFDWTAGHRPLAGVSGWPSVGLLAAVTVGFLALGIVGFVRRDLGASSALAWLRLPSLPAGVHGPFTRQLSDRVGVAIAWGVGIGVYAALIAGSARQFAEVILSLPQIQDYLSVLYPDIDLLQPSGLLQLAFFSFGTILIGLAGATAVAGWASDETDGRLDVILSTPQSRVGWFLRSSLGVLAAIAITSTIIAAIVGVSVAAVGGEVRDVVLGTLVLGLAAGAFASVGLAVGGLVRASLAAPVTAVLVIATFMLDLIGAALELPDPILELSLFKHLGQPMAGQYDPVGVLASLVLIVGGLAVGAWGLQRRDLDR